MSPAAKMANKSAFTLKSPVMLPLSRSQFLQQSFQKPNATFPLGRSLRGMLCTHRNALLKPLNGLCSS